MSTITAAGWWNAPRRFLPSGRSTAVLPPIAESIWATSVVGTWMTGHAAQPQGGQEPGGVAERAAADRDERLATLGAQPGQRAGRRPRSRPGAWRPRPSAARRPRPSSPRPRSPSAMAAPAAAQAPGSDTRIARRRIEPAERLGDRLGGDAVADDEPPDLRLGVEEPGRGADPGRDQLLDPAGDPAGLGQRVHPVARRRRSARGS